MGVPGWRVVDRPPSQHEHDDAKVAAVFVLEHGEAYGLDVTRGPTSEFIQTWGFHNRTMAFVSRPLRPLYSSSMKERTISFSTSQRDTKILR